MREKLAFRPVTANEFEEFAAEARTQYVYDMVANGGMSRAEATAKAEHDQSGILPAGARRRGRRCISLSIRDVTRGAGACGSQSSHHNSRVRQLARPGTPRGWTRSAKDAGDRTGSTSPRV